MSKAFRFKAAVLQNGTRVRVRPDIWQELHRLRAIGLHGSLVFAEFVSEDTARVTTRDEAGNETTRRLAWDSVRFSNLRNEDERLEPERRRIWKAAHAASPVRGHDTETPPVSTPAIDQDAAHRRPVFGKAAEP